MEALHDVASCARADDLPAGLRIVAHRIPGIGPKRRKALLKHFGSVERIRSASVDALAGAPMMTRPVAEAVFTYLQGASDA